jgi:hypothetical protein
MLMCGCLIRDKEGQMKKGRKVSANPLLIKVLPGGFSPEITGEERTRFINLYKAVHELDAVKVKEYLDQGYDPDRCLGVEGWESNNPLNMVARSFYKTYGRRKRGEPIPSPTPDIAVMQALLAGGANINKLPYVWLLVYERDNFFIEPIPKRSATQEEADEEIKSFIGDANRLVKAFLEAGADPDKLGHPYPFGREVAEKEFTDEEADTYFAQGTRAINEAIKKGMWWESQVDLLLEYTSLDEDSLKAAEESGDPAMVEKIQRLWREQNRTQ